MTSQSSTANTVEVTTTTLERALEELDQVIHRCKALLKGTRKSAIEERLKAWELVRGILKGRIVEDPVVYQRRIRDEEEL